ncbi:hypothetical protein [Streptomyces sp. NPDC091371]|uniref:hypothetical protein n=1 Tax=Streptomyces sp. NPDC091371 TaxID=3155303 RepID=UPI00344835F5
MREYTDAAGGPHASAQNGTSSPGAEYFEPLAVIVAAEIRKLADDGGTIWKSPHQWRDTLSADDWTAVVEGLQGAARALVMAN